MPPLAEAASSRHRLFRRHESPETAVSGAIGLGGFKPPSVASTPLAEAASSRHQPHRRHEASMRGIEEGGG